MDRCMDMYIDRCMDMHMDRYMDMYMDKCTYICTGARICMDMCKKKCTCMRTDMCAEMCPDSTVTAQSLGSDCAATADIYLAFSTQHKEA